MPLSVNDTECPLRVSVDGVSETLHSYIYRINQTTTIDSINPSRGGTAGGTLLTITGNTIPLVFFVFVFPVCVFSTGNILFQDKNRIDVDHHRQRSMSDTNIDNNESDMSNGQLFANNDSCTCYLVYQRFGKCSWLRWIPIYRLMVKSMDLGRSITTRARYHCCYWSRQNRLFRHANTHSESHHHRQWLVNIRR